MKAIADQILESSGRNPKTLNVSEEVVTEEKATEEAK